MTTFEHVVGIDLSLTCTGIASHELGQVSGWTDLIKTDGKRLASWESRSTRIQHVCAELLNLMPDTDALIALEAPAYSSGVGSVWDRAGLWWLVYTELSKQHTILPILPNLRAKYATGKNAGKDEVLAAAVRRYPSWDITNNNTADAVILAAIGARLAGAPFDDGCLPAKNLDALKTLEIPRG